MAQQNLLASAVLHSMEMMELLIYLTAKPVLLLAEKQPDLSPTIWLEVEPIARACNLEMP